MTLQPLQEILKRLSPDALRLLDKFVQSPYFVTHDGVLRLYTYLRKHNNNPDLLDLDAVYRHLFPEGKEDPKRVYHLSHYLREAVEQFLALEEIRGDKHRLHSATSAAFRKMKLNDEAAGMLRYTRKQLNNDEKRGANYYHNDHRLHLEIHLLALQEGKSQTMDLQALSDSQDVAFLVDKLRTGCIMLSQRNVTETTYASGLLGLVIDFLKNHAFLDLPIVAAYYHGYHAQKGGDGSETHFQSLKNVINENGRSFAANEVQDLTLMALNYAIGRLNRGENHYFREVFELYQSGLKHGALLENGQLSRWTYNNITATALRLQEYTWLEQFLIGYQPLLPENHRDAAFHFNMARYCYDLGKRREALGHLLHREYDNVLQNLQSRVLMCKIYYELGEWDALDNQIDSLQIYLRRQKGIGYHRAIYGNIARMLRKLVNTNDRERLRAEIEAIPELPEREWLLKQV
ncbi:MAG: hypothetical protein IT270_11320 [Saprospiraceae bacterium]|nr:hypothetical protein [Saprospiraceae bacterium]